MFKGFHRRRCDTSRKRYAVKEAFADQVASDKGKLAPGVVSFIGPLFQRCGHPGAAFGPECPPSWKQLRRDCLDPSLARSQRPQQVFDRPARLKPGGDRLVLLLPLGRCPVRTLRGCRTRPLGREL